MFAGSRADSAALAVGRWLWAGQQATVRLSRLAPHHLVAPRRLSASCPPLVPLVGLLGAP
jgi:hypothetical protein